jgi:hypothetical protein
VGSVKCETKGPLVTFCTFLATLEVFSTVQSIGASVRNTKKELMNGGGGKRDDWRIWKGCAPPWSSDYDLWIIAQTDSVKQWYRQVMRRPIGRWMPLLRWYVGGRCSKVCLSGVTKVNCRLTYCVSQSGIVPASGVPRGGVGVFKAPRNSEGPPKSSQTQHDCENC